jgi:pyruvate kinase
MNHTTRRTRIVATIGPVSNRPAMINKLMRAGMDVARINFAHEADVDVARLVRVLRAEARKLNRPVAILGDLAGPKLRTGPVADGPVQLRRGQMVQVYNRQIPSEKGRVGVNLPSLTGDVKKGHRVLLDDGRIRLRTMAKARDHLVCRVEEGGWITPRRGLNLPDSRIRVPALTPADRAHLKLAVALGFDVLALSFVRSADDILTLKRALGRLGSEIPVIAKIEKPEALTDLAAVIAAADGVMVARGDLGVELSPEEVPVAQKKILAETCRQFKPTIVATQMLESMIESATPTRAEASDIANAVFDGADALMLSGETAVGKHAVEAVRTMHRIAVAAEQSDRDLAAPARRTLAGPDALARATAEAGVEAATRLGARYLICYTESGRTARMLSKLRPPMPILALASSIQTVRRLRLLWGVTPYRMKPGRNYDRTLRRLGELLRKAKLAARGDLVVMLSATPLSKHAEADTIKLLRLE